MDCSMPGSFYFIITWSLLKLIYMSGGVMQPLSLLLSPSSMPSIFPSIKIFSNESVLYISWPKYWSFSFNISPSNVYSWLISFRIDCLISLLPKGWSRVFPNTIVQKHQFCGTVHSLWSNSHIHTWLIGKKKYIACTRRAFVGKAMSLIFNMWARFVIAFLPRRKCLLYF